jgi:MFS transporter, PAT family, beta-lactamase induction signal transducer AmpG
MTAHTERMSWQQFRDSRVISMIFLGFTAGLPLLLIFSSLSLWLREAGVAREAVTFFSWAALGYSFKFIWAPLIDRLPLPLLTRQLGRRRAWLLVAQLAIISAIVLMASIDPASGADSLTQMAIAAVLLGFSAATQDIVIDAYRIEIAPPELQALLSAVYIAGYRVGMVVAGAGALTLAAWFGSTTEVYSYAAWQTTYLIMAALVLIGVFTTLLIQAPDLKAPPFEKGGSGGILPTVGGLANRLPVDESRQPPDLKSPQPPFSKGGLPDYPPAAYLRLLAVFGVTAAAFVLIFFLSNQAFIAMKAGAGAGALTHFVLELLHFALALTAAGFTGWLLVKVGAVNRTLAQETWIAPAQDFFQRYGLNTALLLLALIGLYRISDIVLGVIANVFYQDLGFTKPQIAAAVQTFGVVVSIGGGLLGGLLATRYGVMRILLLGAVLSAATNLIFVLLTQTGANLPLLYLAVSADNLAAGLASAAFIAFLSSLTNISFTAVQYAIFSSLMTLLPKLLGGYSGAIVANLGYPGFFLFTTLIGVPVIGLVWLAGRRLAVRECAAVH